MGPEKIRLRRVLKGKEGHCVHAGRYSIFEIEQNRQGRSRRRGGRLCGLSLFQARTSQPQQKIECDQAWMWANFRFARGPDSRFDLEQCLTPQASCRACSMLKRVQVIVRKQYIGRLRCNDVDDRRSGGKRGAKTNEPVRWLLLFQ